MRGLILVMSLLVLLVGNLAWAQDGSIEWPIQIDVMRCGTGVLNCWCHGWLLCCIYYNCIPGPLPYGCLSPECFYWVECQGLCGDPAVPVYMPRPI